MNALSRRADELRLPAQVLACLFDLDGVLTQTARLHAAAWKEMFDAYLRMRARADGHGASFVPFDVNVDYAAYVDGKERNDGVRSFLRSRGIALPEGTPGDPPEADTVIGLGTRKNKRVLALIEHEGVAAYAGSVRFVRAARAHRLRCAVVSSSSNCSAVLEAAGIADLFEATVDALVAARDHLAGKPAPDTFLAAAEMLGADPSSAAVFEDSLAGIQAGRAGRFALVVGVDRIGQAAELRARGADIVVSDLDELLVRR
jgi:beta-phosphoglucomutase family hydrolase